MKYDPYSPLPDEDVLHLLAILRREFSNPDRGAWEQQAISGGIVALGIRLHVPPRGEMSSAQGEALAALLEFAKSPHAPIAASAAHSLGVSKRREGISALQQIIQNDDFIDDATHAITVRGIAFRALMRIDREAARPFVGSRACREYLLGVENWLRELRERNAAEERVQELIDETAWLRQT